MNQTRLAHRALWCVALMLLATAVFAASKKLKPADLEMLVGWFGGVYDSAPAAGASAADGHVLILERISAPMISWHVFYAEERDAEGLTVAQQLLSFEISKDKKTIVETSFAFKEPRRWHDGLDRPDVFKAIIPDDLSVASGCEIFWFRENEGFVGRSVPKACRLRARITGMTMPIELYARLTPAEFIYGDRMFHKRAVGAQ